MSCIPNVKRATLAPAATYTTTVVRHTRTATTIPTATSVATAAPGAHCVHWKFDFVHPSMHTAQYLHSG